MAVVRMLDAITLQRAEVIRIAELGAQLLENRPVAFLALRADLARQMAPEIVGDPIVVQQRVVDVEKKYDRTMASISFAHQA